MHSRRLVVISDHCSDGPPVPVTHPAQIDTILPPPPTGQVTVTGGYLERLPLAAIAAGIVDTAEIWSFAGRCGESDASQGLAAGRADPDRPGLTRRVFRADAHDAPYGSAEAVRHLQQLLPGHDWHGVRALGTHPRIADAARAAGFGRVEVTRPGLDDMCASIESLR